MNLAKEDYDLYKGMDAYAIPNFQGKKDWCAGKGAGSPECKKYEEAQQAQNNNSNTTPDKPTQPNQPTEPKIIVFKI